LHTIHALHGFLGLAEDWDPLSAQLMDAALIKHKLFHDRPIEPFWDWARKFNDAVSTRQCLEPSLPLLMGYSLGGRLAMHALRDAPTLWKGAILVSCHLGFQSEQEKRERYASDCEWGNCFLSEPWDQLMHHWNGREMFSGDSFAFKRFEKDYMRDLLAKSIETWSLGNQDNMREAISEMSIPILWVAGENDLSYKARAQTVTLRNPLSRVWIAPGSGHRVPWEQPDAFLRELQKFLTDIRTHHEVHTAHHLEYC